jgi:hypothetical protein
MRMEIFTEKEAAQYFGYKNISNFDDIALSKVLLFLTFEDCFSDLIEKRSWKI